MVSLFYRTEKFVGNGENASYQYFLLLHLLQIFSAFKIHTILFAGESLEKGFGNVLNFEDE